jgi:hypothetical protein
MQSERVTFLTSREHKAALDAFAASSGQSVGNVVREATARYMSEPPQAADEGQKAPDLLVGELEAAIPTWNAKFDSMEASIARARQSIRDAVAAVKAMK